MAGDYINTQWKLFFYFKFWLLKTFFWITSLQVNKEILAASLDFYVSVLLCIHVLTAWYKSKLKLKDVFIVLIWKHTSVKYKYKEIFYPSNKSEEFPQIHQPWWLSLRNFRGISRESFPVTNSSEILEKFPRIGPQD